MLGEKLKLSLKRSTHLLEVEPNSFLIYRQKISSGRILLDIVFLPVTMRLLLYSLLRNMLLQLLLLGGRS